MEIRKEYNVKEIMNQFGEEVKGKFKGAVIISPALAQDILDILKEVYRREQKHQTIESALVFDELEENEEEVVTKEFKGAQKNVKTEHKIESKENNLPDCFNVMCGIFEACKRCEYRSVRVHGVKEQTQREGISVNE